MASRADLVKWVEESLRELGGKSQIVPLCKSIWAKHGREIERSGDLFYTWQYDMRWAATVLRRRGTLTAAEESPRGVWELKD